MIAKLIAHAPTRQAALDRLAHALDRTLIAGVRSNVAFLAKLCRADELRRGKVDTGFIDRNLAMLGAVPQPRDNAAAALGVAHLLNSAVANEVRTRRRLAGSRFTLDEHDGFQLGGVRSIAIPIVDRRRERQGERYLRERWRAGRSRWCGAGARRQGLRSGADDFVVRCGRQTRVRIQDFSAGVAAASAGDGVIKAPMHGKVLELLAGVGDRVAVGQRLAVIEAMKMEHTLRAPFAGVVTQVPVRTGAQVVESAPIMVLEQITDNETI